MTIIGWLLASALIIGMSVITGIEIASRTRNLNHYFYSIITGGFICLLLAYFIT